VTESGTPLFTATIALPAGLNEDQASRFAEAFGEDAVLSTSMLRKGDPFHGTWALQWLFVDKPDATFMTLILSPIAKSLSLAMPEITIEQLPDINWLEHSYRQFPPFSVGPFFIHGSHYQDETPKGQIDLEIEAATAFGSGEHGTTSGCLILMNDLKESGHTPAHVLDMGCGSGILGIGAIKLWDCTVLAIDIDPESVHVTENHCRANGIYDRLTAKAGDGFAIVEGHYDLTIANILPVPLKAMAPDLVSHMAPGGYAILSGLLLDQAQDVLDVYLGLGLRLEKRLDRGEWSALLVQK
jgi:ribosomal protein L11 methyltransferase